MLARQSARQQVVATPYHGGRYRTDDLTPLYCETETAIHECDVISDYSLEDREVRTAFERLIWRLGRELPLYKKPEEEAASDRSEFIIASIVWHWNNYFETRLDPGRDTLIGVLRTLLSSLQIWGKHDSRGYLDYLKKFLQKLGVSLHRLSPQQAERLMSRATRRSDLPE